MLRIAVIGHTRLEAPAEVERSIASAIKTIMDAAKECFDHATWLYAEGAEPEYRIVCGLAPGTDQFAAGAAARLGLGVTFVLPDEPTSYAERLAAGGADFAEAGARIKALEGDKHVLGVVYAKREAGYDERTADLWAARKTIEHAEVLVAVWDGRERDSVTGVAIREALRRGQTVVWILGAKTGAPRPESASAAEFKDGPGVMIAWRRSEPSGVHADIANALRPIIDPYFDVKYQPQGWLRSLATFVGETLQRPKVFAREAGKPMVEFEEERERQLKLLSWSLWNERMRWAFLGESWHRYVEGPHKRVVKARLESEEFREPDSQPDGPPRAAEALQGSIESWQESLASALPQADDIAGRFMGAYRLAFVATFLLGALAVFLAVLAFLLKIDCLSLFSTHKLSSWVGLGVAGLEFVVLAIILIIFVRSNTSALHVRAVDYRRLAELFRHAQALMLVGAVVPPADAQGREKGEPIEWFEWYFRAVMSSIDFGLASGKRLALSPEYLAAARHHLAEKWIRDQRNYHRITWRRYKLLEHGFHRWTVILFATVATVVFAGIAFGLADKFGYAIPSLQWITALVVVVAAGFPALAGALHGIASQGEFERLTHSYRHMEHYLSGVITTMRNIRSPDAPEAVEQVALHAAEQMLREVEDWHRAYRHHTAVQLP